DRIGGRFRPGARVAALAKGPRIGRTRPALERRQHGHRRHPLHAAPPRAAHREADFTRARAHHHPHPSPPSPLALTLPNPAPLLHDFLCDSARRLPDKIALVCRNDRVTYAELDARSNALAHALVARGVARGDRVVVFADNTVETVVAFWAVLKANAVVSIVNPL